MEQTKINYLVNLVMGAAFVLVAVTGLMKFPGILRFFGIRSINLPIGRISQIHDWSGIVLAVFVLIHLVLHWKWIFCMTKGMFIKKGEKKCEN